MKMNDLDTLNELSSELKHATEKAKGHYFDVTDDNEALLHLLVRSVKHSEQDDRKLFAEVAELKDRIAALETIISKLTH